MGHKKQVIRFGIMLNCTALAFFVLSMVTKFYIFTLFGFLCLLGAAYVNYIYLPGLKRKKKEKKIVLEEVKPTEVFDLKDWIKIYWDKFIVWLHT